MEITADSRFGLAVSLFNEGEYFEASELFEELFFEGVRDEPDFVRVFLQFSVGIFHAQTGQWRPAVERIEEGLRLIAANRDDHGIDLSTLANGMKRGVQQVRGSETPRWPRVERRV